MEDQLEERLVIIQVDGDSARSSFR